MAELTLPEVITRFRGNEARIADFANGNAAGYYITVDGRKVETLPSVVSRLAAAIAAASATADTLKGTGGSKLIGFGAVTVDAALTTQAKGIADNAKAIADLDKAKLAKDGGTMTGPLTLAGAPTDALHAATKGWAEGLIGTYWKPVVGDLLTTARGAPDSTWIPDGANYLQASYAPLFAKLGLLQTDNTTNNTAWSQATTAVLFVADESSLRVALAGNGPDLGRVSVFWVVYPKGGRSDLDRDSLWPIVAELGLRPIAQVAVDDVWSALRFRPLAPGEPQFRGR